MSPYKGFKQDMIACLGEFAGTTMFIFLGLGCVKTAQNSVTVAQTQTITSLSNQTIMFISLGMGMSLLVTAWVFYRITGGLFNPAVTFALFLVGAVKPLRALMLTVAQIAGGIAGSALVAVLTPLGGISNAVTTLQTGMNKGQGLFIEAFLTAMLVFTILMLAAEKHRGTFLAPVGIGLCLFVCQLFGTLWTGCGMNPARSFGPSVVSGTFPGYHWIYWVGPFIGSLIAVFFYTLLKVFDYGSVVMGQDSSDANRAPAIHEKIWAHTRFSKAHRHALHKAGVSEDQLAQAEAGMAQDGLHSRTSDLNGERSTLAGDDRPIAIPDATLAAISSPSMKPGQQAIGGLVAPGTEPVGLAAHSKFKSYITGADAAQVRNL